MFWKNSYLHLSGRKMDAAGSSKCGWYLGKNLCFILFRKIDIAAMRTAVITQFHCCLFNCFLIWRIYISFLRMCISVQMWNMKWGAWESGSGRWRHVCSHWTSVLVLVGACKNWRRKPGNIWWVCYAFWQIFFKFHIAILLNIAVCLLVSRFQSWSRDQLLWLSYGFPQVVQSN